MTPGQPFIKALSSIYKEDGGKCASLLEPSSSVVDAASEDLSLGLLRHLAEIPWLSEGTRLQHVAAIFKEFPGGRKTTETPLSLSSNF